MKNNFLRSLKIKKISLLKKIKELRAAMVKMFSNTSGSDVLRSRPFLAAVALALSFMIWAFVAWDGSTTRTFEVPIRYINISQGYTTYDGDKTVQARVFGPVPMLSRIEAAEFSADVDLQGLQTGKYKLPIRISPPPYVHIRSWSPSVAEVEIYRQIERTLPVAWKLQGKLPAGKIIGKVEIVPAEVTLAGPEAEVLSAQSLEVFVPTDKLGGGAAVRLPVKVSDSAISSDKVLIAPGNVNVKVTLEDEIIGEQIPVNVSVTGTPAEGLEIAGVKILPERVTIRGSGEAVRQVKSLNLSPIDITGLEQNLQLMLPLQPSEPVAGIEIMGPDRVRVEITVRRKMTAKTYNAVPVKLSGGTFGTEWQLTPSTAAVTIESSQSRIDSLPSGEVPCELYVDVSNIVARQITVPVLVRKLQRDFEVVQVEPEQVTVTMIDGVD